MKCKPTPQPPKDCCQALYLDNTTGNLTLGPNGNTVNICEIVKTCESDTLLYSVRLVGNILEIVYVGENGVPQTKTVDFTGILGGGGSSFITSVQDTNSIDLNVSSGILTALLKVDSAGTAPVSISSDGVRIDCCPQTLISVTDTNTIDLTASGTNNHTLSAVLKYSDSNTIDFSDSGSGLTGIVRLNNGGTNLITSDVNGLLVSSSVVRALVSGVAPINYNNATGVITIAQSTTTTDGYLSSADWNIFNGKVDGGASLGSGSPVFAGEVSKVLNFKSIVAGSNVVITQTANDITISAGASAFTVDYLSTVTAITTYTGLASAIIVGSNENYYLKYTGPESSDGYFIVTDGNSNKWKIAHIDATSYFADGTYIVKANTLLKRLIVKPTSALSAFKIGSTSGNNDIVLDTPIAGGSSAVFDVSFYADGSDTNIFIGGISPTTLIRFYKD